MNQTNDGSAINVLEMYCNIFGYRIHLLSRYLTYTTIIGKSFDRKNPESTSSISTRLYLNSFVFRNITSFGNKRRCLAVNLVLRYTSFIWLFGAYFLCFLVLMYSAE